MKPKIYILDYREIHLFGSVGVCWSLKTETDTIRRGGLAYEAKFKVRHGDPYLDLVWIREYDGQFYESEDDPLDGGFGAAIAPQLIRELQAAAEYIENRGWKDA